jgi:DNA-binding NarL/FixJ family response regulator
MEVFMITDREREVLRFIKDGYENHEIALRICISVHTVKAHLGSIMRKIKRAQPHTSGLSGFAAGAD